MHKLLVFGDAFASGHSQGRDDSGWVNLLGLPEACKKGSTYANPDKYEGGISVRLREALSTPSEYVILSLMQDCIDRLTTNPPTPHIDANTRRDLVQASIVAESFVKLPHKPVVLCVVYDNPFSIDQEHRANHVVPAINGASSYVYIRAGAGLLDLHGKLPRHSFDGNTVHPLLKGQQAIAGIVRSYLGMRDGDIFE